MTLCRLLLEKKREKRRNAQEVLAALSFLEVEERTGRASLDVTEFRYIVARFCELARLDPDEVCQEPHSMMPLSWAQQTSTQPSARPLRLHMCMLSFSLPAFSGRVLHRLQSDSFLRLASSVLLHPMGAVHSNTSVTQIIDGLIQLAIANEIGVGPSLKEAMEQEVNEQVGLPPSQGASKSGSQKGQ